MFTWGFPINHPFFLHSFPLLAADDVAPQDVNAALDQDFPKLLISEDNTDSCLTERESSVESLNQKQDERHEVCDEDAEVEEGLEECTEIHEEYNTEETDKTTFGETLLPMIK